MLHVIKTEIKKEYELYVEFNNGVKGIIDFRKIIEDDPREIIKQLLNKKIFDTVKVNLNTLCWDNDVDFAPEYLYGQIVLQEKKSA